MSITPIDQPLPGEQIVALSPQDAAETAVVWLARPNLFPGRALTAPTLERRQRWQAGRLALRGQATTAGVVTGLEVGHHPSGGGNVPQDIGLTIAAGFGLAVTGEDVRLPRPVEFDLKQLPVFAEPSVEAGLSGDPGPVPALEAEGEAAPAAAEAAGDTDVPVRARAILKRSLGALFAAAPAAIARVGVLVLQPVKVDLLGEFDPTDPCELQPCGEAGDNTSFEDWRIGDGVRLVWYAWPREWRELPADGPTLRNELAWTIFQAEAGLTDGSLLPWEELGVPLALIALDAQLQPLLIDRASVVRLGGRARDPRLTVAPTQVSAQWRRAPLWQAQIEQLAEQIADAGDPPPAADTLAQNFARLPPAGLLPRNAIDLSVLPLNAATETLRSDFFPGSFELDAVPVPVESLDLAIREAAGLAPLDMAQPERVRVLVPVPQSVYEPRLLLEEVIDPEFQATLDHFLLARAGALGARQGLRLKRAELIRLATGQVVPVPPLEQDSEALEAESLAPWGPPPPGGGHRSQLAAGFHQHFFTGATARLAVAPSDTLYAWVYLDPDHPPRVLMLQWNDGNGWEHRAYWAASGDEMLLPWGVDGTPSHNRIDDLPELGRWLRLDVPAATVALGNAVASGMAFTMFDGQAAFGETGRINADGLETPWFSNALPAGAVAATSGDGTEPWTFLTPTDLDAPFEPALGLNIDPQQNASLGRSMVLSDLLANPALAELVVVGGLVTGGVLSATERNQLSARGLEGFISFLKSRADRADDLIDYGFIKVQTDTYRVRQLILGTTAATRLAISPTLATIAQAETATASQERISTFFGELKTSAVTRTISAAELPSAAPLAAALRASATAPAGTITRSAAAKTGAALRAAPASALAGMTGAGTFSKATVTTETFSIGAVGLKPGIVAVESPGLTVADKGAIFQDRFVAREELKVLPPPSAPPLPTPKDVTQVDPLIGKATIRTTTIAQRLEAPKALEAKNYATATRHDAVDALLQFADQLRSEDGDVTPGLFAGINVYGLAGDPFLSDDDKPPPPDRRFLPFAAFIATRSRLTRLLNVPDSDGDEGAHFSNSVDLSDNTVALMRQVEGRVKLYRDAIAACENARNSLNADITGLAARLSAWDSRLAEARHDVAVTRALIAEENDRLAAINARRSAVLSQDVRFLAYIRPREMRNLIDTPVHRLDPGLLDAPVPACLGEHADVPDDLTAMLAVLREAPAVWFVAVPKLIDQLNRVDLLVRTVQTAQLRSQVFALRTQPLAIAATASPMVRAIGAVQTRQRQAVLETRQLASMIDVAQLATMTWRGARDQTQKVVSLGDLIDGEHGRGDIASRAAAVYDLMAHVAACLHAEFSAVLPSIRLDWAERLSQFDQAPRLRDLTVLPRWAEIAYVDRKQMQGFVDWLFDQIDGREPRAQDLMNDVVRMCLLLAADAPIGRILAGRLPRPAIARQGVRIPLTVFDPARLRIGMQALIYNGAQVAVRAVVEDIGSEVSARVISTAAAEVSLTADARVQFSDAAQVSLARQPALRLPALAKMF